MNLSESNMKSTTNSIRVLMVGATLLFTAPMRAQPIIPPGVPEPGLIIWGTVVNTTNSSQSIPITTASWAVTDGTKSAVFNDSSTPPVRILTQGSLTYYVLEVPFDSRTFGTVVLSDPAAQGVNSFELKAASQPTYTLLATINGLLASVRAIDGVTASGTNVSLSGFNSMIRGRAVRVDLSITPPLSPYDTWAARYFGSAGNTNAAPSADPDLDGMNNAAEYLAGTDPTDRNSSLRILSLNYTESQMTLSWMSATNKTYRIETAAQADGPYTEVGSVGPSTGNTTQGSITRSASDQKQFYRIRLAQ